MLIEPGGQKSSERVRRSVEESLSATSSFRKQGTDDANGHIKSCGRGEGVKIYKVLRAASSTQQVLSAWLSPWDTHLRPGS